MAARRQAVAMLSAPVLGQPGGPAGLHLRVALADADEPAQRLADEPLTEAEWERQHDGWTRRARQDPRLAREVRKAMARARRALRAKRKAAALDGTAT